VLQCNAIVAYIEITDVTVCASAAVECVIVCVAVCVAECVVVICNE